MVNVMFYFNPYELKSVLRFVVGEVKDQQTVSIVRDLNLEYDLTALLLFSCKVNWRQFIGLAYGS